MKQFAVALVLFFATSAAGQDLHAILIADTNDGTIGASVQVDLNNLGKTLKVGLPVGRLHVTKVIGADVNKEHVIELISELAIQPDDSVLVYYSGHGGFDVNDGHRFYFSNGEFVLRSEVVSSITQPYTPRFWALITDCCSNVPEAQQRAGCGKSSGTVLLEELFLRSRGRIDITSSRPQQVAYGTSLDGGTFTLALCQVFTGKSDMRLTWNEAFEQTREITSASAESFLTSREGPYTHRSIPQRTQTAYSFKTMRGEDVNGPRLGVSHSERIITDVIKGSPADVAGLKPGMKIQFVNGVNILDDAHLMTAVNFSARKCQIRIENRLNFYEPVLSY